MPEFPLGELSVHYVDSGTGVPFVFQHGIGGDVRQPTSMFSPPAGVRLLSFDARAHGRTVPMCDPTTLNFSTLGDDLVAFLDYLELPRAVVGGISMGAAVALNVALRFPHRVAGLVLSRPAWLDRPMADEIVSLFERLARLLRELGSERRERALRRLERDPAFVAMAQRSPDTAASLRTQILDGRAVDAVARLERLPRDRPIADLRILQSVRAPTLVLAQHRDALHPFEIAVDLVGAIPGASFAQLTPKSVDPARHTADVQRAVGRFLEQFTEAHAPGAEPGVSA